MKYYLCGPLMPLVFATMVASVLPSRAQTMQINGKFDVGGRSIRLMCHETSEPTVVVNAGMGTAPTEDKAWNEIAAKIAPLVRICLYDRAGLGGSDAAPEPTRTSADSSATDLDRALQAAGLKPPYVIVGHSIGGLNAQVSASLYPKDVSARVLASSTHPDQMRRWLVLLPAAKADDPKPLVDARDFLS